MRAWTTIEEAKVKLEKGESINIDQFIILKRVIEKYEDSPFYKYNYEEKEIIDSVLKGIDEVISLSEKIEMDKAKQDVDRAFSEKESHTNKK